MTWTSYSARSTLRCRSCLPPNSRNRFCDNSMHWVFSKMTGTRPNPTRRCCTRLCSSRGQPLGLALIALEIARRLEIALEGVNFPGHFLLRVPGADHLLDPCSGRRLYPRDCRELLIRQFGPTMQLRAEHMTRATPTSMLQRLSRNLRHLHQINDDFLAALKDADRIVELGQATSGDHLARASLYQLLECPQAERFDLERALLLSEDPLQRIELAKRLSRLPANHSVH
ncbi:Protein sirB1 [Pseudomonas amygdali pv. lachrymans]|uniref:Protein sirB1 n=1 Tax=Pseudomonas amygdali pv. lachrymans TaxID=53707 RepID=A0AB37R3Q3_PSEAV|nr:Protein sirB1 [Pseudomonas amygdali pv. lachrymans]